MTDATRTNARQSATIVVLLCAMAGVAPLAAAEITVSLDSGRVVRGEIDARTDDRDLWIRASAPNIVLRSAFPWETILSARVSGKTLSTHQLQQAAGQLKTSAPVVKARPQVARPPVLRAPAPQVQSLDAVATIANWDRDAAPDGIAIRLFPLNAHGDSIPVEGLVSMRLYGRRRAAQERLESQTTLGFFNGGATIREYAPRINNQEYLEIARASERLRAVDGSESGYVIRLPFRNVEPERDLDITIDAEVLIHLSVRGQGVYDASCPVLLRGFSPFRRQLQLDRGTRFFPGEL